MLGDRCIHVKRGDRLGLVFNTVASPVYYGVYQFHYRTSIQHLPKVGDRLQFNHDLKVRFVATGFVNVSEYYYLSTNKSNIYSAIHCECFTSRRIHDDRDFRLSIYVYCRQCRFIRQFLLLNLRQKLKSAEMPDRSAG